MCAIFMIFIFHIFTPMFCRVIAVPYLQRFIVYNLQKQESCGENTMKIETRRLLLQTSTSFPILTTFSMASNHSEVVTDFVP